MRKIMMVALFAILAGCGGGSEPTPVQVTQAPQVSTGTMQVKSAQVRGYSVSSSETAKVAGYRENFTVQNQNGIVTVTSKVNPMVVQVFHNIKQLKFADKTVSYDIEGPSGKVFRLYQAAFDRVPDHGGLGFWVQMYENGGLTIEQVALEFSKSAEFKRLYGDNITNEVFVKLVYNNVLNRDPDQGGYDFWLNAMANHGLTREALMYNFSESNENKQATLPAMINGFEYNPFRTPTIVPLGSSYANKETAFRAMGQITIPKLEASHFAEVNYAMGDFFQDGTYSLVVNSGDFSSASAPDGYTKQPGKIYFFRMINGQWVDHTAGKVDSTVGCVTARKLLVADFNGDAKPDVFVACTGIDTHPFPGENQRVLLSQADGTYKNVLLPFKAYAHGAAAADFNGNGYASVVLADQTVAATTYMLVNNKDGTFKQDFTRLPTTLSNKLVWTVELINTGSGKYDAILAGADPASSRDAIQPTIFHNDGNNYFTSKETKLPLIKSSVEHVGPGAVLDFTFNNGNLFMLSTFDYKAMAIRKINLMTLVSTEVYSYNGAYAGHPTGKSWFPWIYSKGEQVLSTEAVFGVTVQ